MKRVHWGTQIVRGLGVGAILGGCASNPPPEPPPPVAKAPPKPAAPLPPVPPAADPPDAKAGWQEVAQLSLPLPKPVVRKKPIDPLGPEAMEAGVAVARGAHHDYLFDSRSASGPGYRLCWSPREGTSGCDELFVAKRNADGTRGPFRHLSNLPQRPGGFGRLNDKRPLIFASMPFTKDAKSKSVVLDMRRKTRKKHRRKRRIYESSSPVYVAQLRPDGDPIARYKLLGTSSISHLRIFEDDASLTVFVVHRYRSAEIVQFKKGKDGALELKRRKETPFFFADRDDTAASGRAHLDKKSKYVFGDWDMRYVSKADTPPHRREFAIAWMEAIAPPKYTPRASGRREYQPIKGKNGCGGAPSRPLTDRSVKKRVHISRLRGDGKVVSDKVYPFQLPNSDWFYPRLRLSGTPEDFRLNGAKLPLVDNHGPGRVPLPGLRKTLAMTGESPSVRSLTYDAWMSEGLIAIRYGKQGYVQRVDSLGKPIGAPQPLGRTYIKGLPPPPKDPEKAKKASIYGRFIGTTSLDPNRVFMLGDAWMMVDSAGSKLTQVTGDAAGLSRPILDDSVTGMPRHLRVVKLGRNKALVIRLNQIARVKAPPKEEDGSNSKPPLPAAGGPPAGEEAPKPPIRLERSLMLSTLEVNGANLENLRWHSWGHLRDAEDKPLFKNVKAIGVSKSRPIVLGRSNENKSVAIIAGRPGSYEVLPSWPEDAKLRFPYGAQFEFQSYRGRGLLWKSRRKVVAILPDANSLFVAKAAAHRLPYLKRSRPGLARGRRGKGVSLFDASQGDLVKLVNEDSKGLVGCPQRVQVAENRWLFVCLKAQPNGAGPPQVVTRLWRGGAK